MFNRDKRRAAARARRERIARRRMRAGGRRMPRRRVPPLAMDDVARAARNVRRPRSIAPSAIATRFSRCWSACRRPSASAIPDVGRSATALAERCAASRSRSPTSTGARRRAVRSARAEISRLENAANPLDRAGSEERVRRLAFLKRQRRALADVSAKRGAIAGEARELRVALQNMRLDLMRLSAGRRRRRSTSRRWRWTR